MRKSILPSLIVILLVILASPVRAKDKTVLLDISHDRKAEYTKVNPQIFELYQEIVEEKLGASLVVNEEKELDNALLAETDVLIILSPLNKKTLKNMTPTEREAVVSYVKKGGKLIFFTDEDHRMDVDAFGGNDIVGPFGMKLGGDLPYRRNVMAIGLVGEVIKGKHELPYSGSRELTGGIPLSVMNAEGGYVHGAYVKLDNGGKIAAFGETMVGLFMGGVEMKMPNGDSVTWGGKGDRQYMRELIEWMLGD